MSIWNYILLVGGLAIFLYGMLMMNNSLTAIAGEKLRSVMLTLTRGKVRGYLTGLGVTIVNQSSSATTVLEAVLVGAGLMTFQQSLAVTLGSELGSTFLGQLVAFPKITRVAPLIIAAAFFASLLVRSRKSKNITLTVIGFGLLLLGMDMMSTSLEPLRSY
jgi:phosphate:Na+ symporter